MMPEGQAEAACAAWGDARTERQARHDSRDAEMRAAVFRTALARVTAMRALVQEVEAFLSTVGDHRIARATRDEPAEFTPTHEASAEHHLREALHVAKLALDGGPA